MSNVDESATLDTSHGNRKRLSFEEAHEDAQYNWSDRVKSSVITWLQRPGLASDGLQILKSVIAATVAWWIADDVLQSQVAVLAPWVALLTVYPTVYQSLLRGAQTTVASWLGTAVSFIVGHYLGVSLWTFALAILVGLVAARIPWVRNEGVAIATTSIFVLGGGFGEQMPMLTDRLIEVAVGAGVGIVANLLLIPPLRDREAARYVDHMNHRMGDLLAEMADSLESSWTSDDAEDWFREGQRMGRELDAAWQTVRTAKESRRANPRRHLAGRMQAGSPSSDAENADASASRSDHDEILQRLDEGISHFCHLVRTLWEASHQEHEWDRRFIEPWAATVRDAGRVIADPDADVDPIHERLDELTEDLGAEDSGLPHDTWPLYG